MIQRNDPCWCGSQKKWKKCHYPEKDPKDAQTSLKEMYKKQFDIHLKNAEEIEGIRKACRLAAYILNEACLMAKEGVKPIDINDYVHKLHLEHGATPASLNYGQPPFPRSLCISLNEVICHGIADERPFQKGDIANLDVALIVNGYCGDCSRMVIIGEETDHERQLVTDVSYESLMRAIAILKPGIPLSKIGQTISDFAESKGCSVVHQFVGHGIGRNMHEAPQVPHCRNHLNIPLAPGMTFTIEPMINAGKPDAVIDQKDKWTARTVDGKPSAQWEHSVLITEEGHEILTAYDFSHKIKSF